MKQPGLLPGVALGSYLLASIHPDWLKLATYCLLLPLILLQAGGVRRAIRATCSRAPFGHSPSNRRDSPQTSMKARPNS